MKKRQKVLILLSLASILVNVVLGEIISTHLKVPLLFMDSVGTVFMAVYGGIAYGVAVGVLTNVLMAMLGGNMVAAWFALVSVAIAITAGLLSRKGYTLDKAIAGGFAISFVAALVAIPIRLFLLNGYVGSGTQTIINAMTALGAEVFSATFISTVISNLVDKLLTCFIVYALINLLPKNLLEDGISQEASSGAGV